MKSVVIGLGSMGKRRIRCLQALNKPDIIGFDLREDRRLEVEQKYGVKTVESFDSLDLSEIDAFIISVPPHIHIDYMKIGVAAKIPCFVEASVVNDGLEAINEEAIKNNVLIAPSCTMRFHPAIKIITSLIKEKKLGKVTNYNYQSGQYLPDWHPWEDIKDFYVSYKPTGGGREIVPFELTWMVDTFGFPKAISGMFAKTIDMGVDIDDSYAATINHGESIGTLLVDVAARSAVRRLLVNFSEGQLKWDWDDNHIDIYSSETDSWSKLSFDLSGAEEGYNSNITEQMYIDEVDHFVKGMDNDSIYPTTLSEDIKVLELLYELERSNRA